MSVIDTTNVIDNSIFLKSKLSKNMVGDNYYIENLQHKRNLDWEYRYNRVDIEEELEKQTEYSINDPVYTPIESVITNVKSDKGDDLGTDWAHLSFKNLKHPCKPGMRYRFSLDFPNMSAMTEEEKYYQLSIWLAVNKSPIRAGNSCTVRRCNTALALGGSPNRDPHNITEVHYEPCVLDNEMKYMQVYYNQALSVPQAEWYATMQLNYYSNSIKINDRFMFGVIDKQNRENNHVYKVKAVIKADTDHTFIVNESDEMESTDLVILALDKDMVGPDDDLETRLACSCPLYAIDDNSGKTEDGQYSIDFNPIPEGKLKSSYYTIRYGKTKEYSIGLYYRGELVDNAEFAFEPELEYVDKGWYSDYFKLETFSDKFRITNVGEEMPEGSLFINAVCILPDGTELSKRYEFKLKDIG